MGVQNSAGLHYFVAILSLTRLFCQRFFNIKNVGKIKNVKNVKNVTKIKKSKKVFLHICSKLVYHNCNSVTLLIKAAEYALTSGMREQ